MAKVLKLDKNDGSLYKRPVSVEALALLLTFLVAAAVVSLFDALHGCGEAAAWLDLLLTFTALYLIAVECFVGNIFLFFLCAAAPFLLILIPRDPFIKVIFGGFAAFACVLAICRRFQTKPVSKDSVSGLIAGLALFTVMFFLSESRDIPYFKRIVTVCGVIYTLGYLLFIHEATLDHSLFMQNQMVMDQPIHRTKIFNRNIFFVFLGAAFVLIELLLLIPWDGEGNRAFLGTFLGYALLGLWRWLLSLIRIESGGGTPVIGGGESGEESSAGEIIGGEPVEGPSAFAEISGYIFVGLVLLAAAFLLVLLLIRIYRIFYEKGKTAAQLMEEEEGISETVEKLERTARVRRLVPVFGRTEADRIRRRYFLKVDSLIGGKVKTSDTPAQTGGILRDDELTALIPLYEEVRYSSHQGAANNEQ